MPTGESGASWSGRGLAVGRCGAVVAQLTAEGACPSVRCSASAAIGLDRRTYRQTTEPSRTRTGE